MQGFTFIHFYPKQLTGEAEANPITEMSRGLGPPKLLCCSSGVVTYYLFSTSTDPDS